MIKIKFQSRNKKTGELLADEASVGSLATAHEELEQLIEQFNIEERRRCGDDARLRELVSVDTGQEGQLQHDWHKRNLVGERNKRGHIVDFWGCSACGMEREVAMVGDVPHSGDCFPERTCKLCGKLFKNARNLLQHMERKH